jgi:uncharacterized membrane protein
MLGIGMLPGSSGSQALGTSQDGSVIVGQSLFGVTSSAFLWMEIGGMRDLKGFLTERGLNLTGWELAAATSVSADGRTIVGYGVGPLNVQTSWIAVIPEPSTALLLCLGLTGLAGKGRRRNRS